MPKDRSGLQDQSFQLLLAWLGPDSELAADEYVRLQKRYAHPYYWASFVLIGNWR